VSKYTDLVLEKAWVNHADWGMLYNLSSEPDEVRVLIKCLDLSVTDGEQAAARRDKTNPYAPLQDRVEACVNACTGMTDPAAEIAELRAASARLDRLLKALEDNTDWPVLTSGMKSGIVCGLEDRNITDCYEAAEYGYEDALDRCHQYIINAIEWSVNTIAKAAIEKARTQ
jgi:hypothetical protein